MAKIVKEKQPEINTNISNKIISKKGIKKNIEYSCYNFRNKEQEDRYQKKGFVPKSTPSIYKEAVINYIISLYNKEKVFFVT